MIARGITEVRQATVSRRGPTQHVAVRIEADRGADAGLDNIVAEAPCFDHTLITQLRQRTEGASAGQLELLLPRIAEMIGAEIVDMDDVDPRRPSR